jgi:cobalt-zinc-cadmium efflux system outer membrane protein
VRVLALLIALAVVAPSAEGRAQDAISFDAAIGLAEEAPELRALDDALEARRSGDGRISDVTELTRAYVVPGMRVLDDQDRGFEGQVQLGHSWNLAGLADARRRSAGEERDALSARTRAAALSRRLEAAYAWIVLHRAERTLALAEDVGRVASELAERTAGAAARGALTEADHAEADAFAAEAEAFALAAEGERVGARVALARAMGTSAPAELMTSGALPEPPLPEPEAIAARLSDVDRLPRVVAARLAAAAIRARDAEVSAQVGLRLDADLIVYRESPAGLMIFPQIGLQIPMADLAARDRSVIAEQGTIAEGTTEATRTDALREAFEVAHEVEHARATVTLLETRFVPALERLVELRTRQLSVGETTVLIALDARRRLLRAQNEWVLAEAARAWAEVRAWLLLAALESGDEGGAP